MILSPLHSTQFYPCTQDVWAEQWSPQTNANIATRSGSTAVQQFFIRGGLWAALSDPRRIHSAPRYSRWFGEPWKGKYPVLPCLYQLNAFIWNPYVSDKKVCDLFDATGSVHPIKKTIPIVTEEQKIDVVAAFHANPRASMRQVAANYNLSKSTIHKIVKKNGLKPYKPTTQHKLFARDYGPRIEFSMSILQQLGDDPDFVRNVMITDECIFYTNGMTCQQNSRMWAAENPHWIREDNNQYRQLVLVWCGIHNRKIYGPYIFDGNVTGAVYLEMLKNYVGDILHNMPLAERRDFWFQQDGAPAHYANIVTAWLNATFANRWIDRNGAIAWPPRSPDLSACDFFLWGYIKTVSLSKPCRKYKRPNRKNHTGLQ